MNKFLKLFLVLPILTISLFVIGISADAYFNPSNEMIKSVSEVKTRDISGVATLYQATVASYNGGTIAANKLSNHATHWVIPNVDIASSDLRLVSYSGGSKTMWQGKKPSEIAKLYEKEHPGWIVVAGINADFFHIDDNCEPIGAAMQEGEFLKAFDNSSGGGVTLGFFEDGRYIFGRLDRSGNEFVERKTSDSYETIAEVKAIDNAPSATGATLLTRFDLTNNPYKEIPLTNAFFNYDLSEYKVYKVTYDLQRYDRYTGNVYVRGIITEINNPGTASYQITDSESYSYLVSKDGSLDSLSIGDEIRCQCQVQGEWAGVTNIVNVYHQVLINSVSPSWDDVEDIDQSYVNCIKNRTVMGFKSDGTPVMMVIEKGSYGAAYIEAGEFLKATGCVEGFLFDGGGSSDLFIRTTDGDFLPVNTQEDGRERSDANAILLVMRDPSFEISVDATRFSATVSLNSTSNEFASLSNLKVNINGVEKAYVEGGVTFDNLEENTEYLVKVSSSRPSHVDSSKQVASGASASFTTLNFVEPASGLSFTKSTKTSITAEKNTTLPTSSMIQEVVIHIGDNTFNMGSAASYECTGLLEDQEYDCYFEYVIHDTDSTKTYKRETDPVTMKTLSYDLPKLVQFDLTVKGNNLTIDYNYQNKDLDTKEAYILVNGTKYVLDGKLGDLKLKDLDFEHVTYEIEFVVVSTEKGKDKEIKTTLKKEVLEKTGSDEPAPVDGSETPEPVEPAKTKKKCGKKNASIIIISMLSLSTLLYFLRKRH